MSKTLISILAMAMSAQAQQVISVSPFQSSTFHDVAYENPVGPGNTGALVMDFKIKCFAPNLRNVPGPLAPDAQVSVEIGVHPKNNRDNIIKMTVNDRKTGANPAPMDPFLGWHFKPFYWTSTSITNAATKAASRRFNLTSSDASAGLSGSAYLNKDQLKVQIRGSELPAVDATGKVDLVASAPYAISYIRLVQQGAPNAKYAGSDGPLNAAVKYKTSPNGASVVGTIDVPAAAKPGQIAAYLGGGAYDEFCGGWYSPLMVFFDEARPQFNGDSKFLRSEDSKVYWPESGAPGYFLALDKNKNGRIDSADELFGNSEGKDGFGALSEFDLNKDQVIDKKDPVFAKLVLWKDWSSRKPAKKGEETHSLADLNVSSIGLKAQAVIRGYGDRAESRAESTFVYKNKQGKESTGAVQDIYFRGR